MRRSRLVAGLAVAVACAVAPVAVFGAPAVPQTPDTPVGPALPGPPDGSGGEAMPPSSTGPGTPTSPTPPTPPVEPPPPPEPTPSIQYVVWGCITDSATPAGAPMRVIWGNRPMRTALGGSGTFTVGIDAATSVRAGWSWQRRSARSGRDGVAGLRAGDIVTAFITARSGTAAAALPAADLILDFGRLRGSRSCAPRR